MNVGFAVQQFLQQDTKNMARMMIKGEHCFSCGLMQFKVLGARCSLLACCLACSSGESLCMLNRPWTGIACR